MGSSFDPVVAMCHAWLCLLMAITAKPWTSSWFFDVSEENQAECFACPWEIVGPHWALEGTGSLMLRVFAGSRPSASEYEMP